MVIEVMTDQVLADQGGQSPILAKPLSPAAQRALAEAEARRANLKGDQKSAPEINGRNGPEPVRYGDWEVKGLASDF